MEVGVNTLALAAFLFIGLAYMSILWKQETEKLDRLIRQVFDEENDSEVK